MLFFCSFLALRAEDTVNPVRSPVDAELHHEREFFAGYEHLLFDSTNAKYSIAVLLTITTSTRYEFLETEILGAFDWKLLCCGVSLKGEINRLHWNMDIEMR